MSQVLDIELSKIFPNPDQPRKYFDKNKLQELAMSIKEHGVQQPIKVTPRNGKYMIVMGERRYRASLLVGKDTIPAILEELSDAKVAELALIENLQRDDLNIIEEAKAFKSLIDKGWSKSDIIKKIGIRQEWRIDEKLSLLNLSSKYQIMIINKIGFPFTNSQAYELSRLPQSKQDIVFEKLITGELGTYNRLRSFVNALIEIEKQHNMFVVELISQQEKEAINKFDVLLTSIERFISEIYENEQIESLRKAGYRNQINSARLDIIIKTLMNIRKTLISGEELKKAMVV